MSVLIKGMEMPKNDEMKKIIIGRAPNGIDPIAIVTGENTEFYKIIEIPTPHGRLIDEEAIYNNVKSRCNNCHIRACAICGVTRILNDIRTAPTIIEAEVSENA